MNSEKQLNNFSSVAEVEINEQQEVVKLFLLCGREYTRTVVPLATPKVIMQGKLIAVAYTLHTY